MISSLMLLLSVLVWNESGPQAHCRNYADERGVRTSCCFAPWQIVEKIRRWNHALLGGELRNGDAQIAGNPSNAPIMKALRCQIEAGRQNRRTYFVNERVMGVSFAHSFKLHGALMKDNPQSLISINEEDCSKQAMKKELGERLRKRIEDELGMKQSAAAEALGWSPQRLNNYIQGIKMMNLMDLAKVAQTLHTSTDWLLGVSESGPPAIEPILVKLLELEKIPTARAQVIAGAVREALQLLRASQGEGDQLQGARMAAQLAWNLKLGPRPS